MEVEVDGADRFLMGPSSRIDEEDGGGCRVVAVDASLSLPATEESDDTEIENEIEYFPLNVTL